MKKIDELKITTVNRVYKSLRNSYVSGCPICGPNQGCNKRYKRKWGTHTSWKDNRENQWK
jgi:hypothetical protein